MHTGLRLCWRRVSLQPGLERTTAEGQEHDEMRGQMLDADAPFFLEARRARRARLSQSRIVLALLSFAIGSVWALGVALGVTIAPASAASSWIVNSTEDTAGDCTPSKCTLRA